MYAVTSPSETQRLTRARGTAAVAFARRLGATRLVRLEQQGPLRILFPRPGREGLPVGVVLVTSGGVLGGDRLDLALEVGAGAQGLFVTQAAEKVYRSDGRDAAVAVSLTAGDGGWLEWLPQETILFDGARLARTTRLAVAGSARTMAGEITVFGRTASGERMVAGRLSDTWEVVRDGRCVWRDMLRLDGDVAARLADPAGFGGAVAAATLILAAPDAGDRLAPVRALLRPSADLKAGATVVAGVLVVRWLGRRAAELREAFGALWAALRAEAGGLPAALPRVWAV
jgi:urease accessory protein